MYKISIIIPVYNTENYLDKCIKSVLNQSYKNIEVILVNDGSNDKSGDICEKYAIQDKRIIVIHQKNLGQSVARNKGIERATGEYIGFVDSDDWISKDMYEYLINLIIKYQADISNINYKLVSDYKDIKQEKEVITIYEENEILYEYLLEGTKRGSYSFCRNLYKKSLFKEVRFPIGKINEDIVTNYKILANSKRMVKSNYITYYYYQENNSTTRGGLKKRDFDLIDVSKELVEISKCEEDKRIVYLAEVKLARSYFSLLAKMCFYGIDCELLDKSRITKMLILELRKNYTFLIKSPIKLSRKLLITVMCINIKIVDLPLKVFHYIKK